MIATFLVAFVFFSICHLGLGLNVGIRESLVSSFIFLVLLSLSRPWALTYCSFGE